MGCNYLSLPEISAFGHQSPHRCVIYGPYVFSSPNSWCWWLMGCNGWWLSLIMHICITQPQWVNTCHCWTGPLLVQVMACHLFSITWAIADVVNLNLKNKLQWTFQQKPIFSSKYYKNVVCKILAIFNNFQIKVAFQMKTVTFWLRLL